MRFKAFEKTISEINTLSLPGIETQLKMAPPFREQLLERYKEERKSAKLAAVLALFYPSIEGRNAFGFNFTKIITRGAFCTSWISRWKTRA